MRRVSSRQRLVSWDAFDATLDAGHESDSSSEHFHHADNIHPLKRKRSPKSLEEPCNTSVSSATSVDVVSAYDWEIQTEPSLLHRLNDDVHLQILEFCDAASVRNMMQVNKRYRNLIASAEASSLWLSVCQQRWPWLGPDQELVDDLHLPAPVLVEDSASIHHSLLLALAAEQSASQIDQAILSPCRWSRSLRRFRPRTSTNQVELEVIMDPEQGPAVHFTGRVGLGDRCIRGNEPLARPVYIEPAPTSILHRLSQFHYKPKTEENVWRPFVVPFMDQDRCMQLTPRLIAYYEVAILPPTSQNTEEPFNFDMAVQDRQRASECIAIGLATTEFHLHTRMPGWDKYSYGYHGDDGGIFHGKGTMVRAYGPSFGVGDVIGCGVDYHARAIFYTRNGKFMGYAFENLELEVLQQDLYPIVGMDTHCPIACNFGCNKPFVFDLKGMMTQQEHVVRHALQR